MPKLTQRLLNITFILGSVTVQQPGGASVGAQRTFTESGTDTLTLSGLRARASIVNAGPPSLTELDLTIWGMTLSQMTQLHTWGLNPQFTGPNFVVVEAGDSDTGFTTVFDGTILNAFIDAKNAPQVSFRVSAQCGLVEAMTNIAGTSYQGSVNVATVMATLAKQMNLDFENNGVSVVLQNPHHFGSAKQQMQSYAEEADIIAVIDNGTLAIWPKGGNRQGETADVNSSTGMNSYPSFSAIGIELTTLFNKKIKHGGLINVTSQYAPANGIWWVARIGHELECFMPNGRWFSEISATRVGVGVAGTG